MTDISLVAPLAPAEPIAEGVAAGPFVIAAVGLAFEARLARGLDRAKVCCGYGSQIVKSLNAAIRSDCAGIISFGIAGGLDPRLKPGTLLVASHMISSDGMFHTDRGWSRALLDSHPHAHHAPILGLQEVIAEPAKRVHYFQETGAAAIDMESPYAASFAAKHRIPFAAFRVIADPAHRRMPRFTLGAVRDDGSINIAGVLREIVRRPADIADLIALGRDVWKARSTLRRSRCHLHKSFAFPHYADRNAN
jgi:adenosylhomocysteine nucleosidase